MPSLAATLRAEMRRLAGGEVARARTALRELRRQLSLARSAARAQGQAIARLERKLSRLKLQTSRAGSTPRRSGPRMAPEAIRALRGAASRHAFAKRVGVSPGSIFGWETGRTIPRGKSVERLFALKAGGGRRRTARRRASASRKKR